VEDIREVLWRLRKDQSERAIALDLGMSRNTVAGYRAWAAEQGLLTGALPAESELARLLSARSARQAGPQEVSKAAIHRDRIRELFDQGVEAKAIWQILQDEQQFPGSYSSVKRFVRRLKAATAPSRAVIRVEVEPGEEAQVDFGYAGRLIDPRSGKLRRAWVFVMLLSFSRHMFAQLVFDQAIATWIRLHVAAFEFFGGVPQRIVLDNLKAGIVKACLYDPEMQRTYRELCRHYDVVARPCRPRTPEHKGKVEKGGVHYVKRNALAGRSFRDADEGNRHLLRWCTELAGRRTHGTTQQVPLEVFESVERAALQPLPPDRWEPCEWKSCRLHPDCYAIFDRAYYSAPHRLVGKQLMVRATDRRVLLFHDHELVATHSRATRAGERQTVRDHLPPEKAAWFDTTPEGCREQARSIGPAATSFVEQLLGERPLDRLRGARRVVTLAQRYGRPRVEAACARALHFDEVRVRTVKSILADGLDFQPLPGEIPAPLSGSAPRHARDWTEFFPDTAGTGGATCSSITS
jgi:transposase